MPETQCHRRARGAFGAQKASETTFETRLWSPDSVVGTSPGAARWQALVSSQGCLQWWVHCRDAQRPGGVDNWQHTGVGRVRFPLPKLPYSLTQLGNCRIPSLEAVCSSHCCHTLRPLPASIAIDIGKAILCAILPYCHGHQSTVHSHHHCPGVTSHPLLYRAHALIMLMLISHFPWHAHNYNNNNNCNADCHNCHNNNNCNTRWLQPP